MLRRENPPFYTSSQRGRSKITTTHLSQCFLAKRNLAIISSSTQPPWCGLLPCTLELGIAPSQRILPRKPTRSWWAVIGHAGSQTGIWASDVTSNVFKETLNTFKVNLITSCYPEKAKYRKNKDLTCTCIYYGQLMLTECFALILDLH